MFDSAPNFEMPADVNGDGVYDVTVIATDSFGNASEQTIAVTVLNVNEAPMITNVSSNPLINLNALDGTNGFTIPGLEENRSLGAQVNRAGDLNDDGLDDLIIVDSGLDNSYVIFGNENGFDANFDLTTLDGSNGFVISSLSPTISSVSSAGDINDDGIDDLIISNDRDGGNVGISYIVYGSDQGFTTPIDLTTLAEADGFKISGLAGDRFGNVVSGVGDLNDDGIDDIAVTAPGAGVTYVIFGSDESFGSSFDLTSLDADSGFIIANTIGTTMSPAGDVNNDGIDDLLIGAPGGHDPNGSAYVVFGSDSGADMSVDLFALDSSEGFVMNGDVNFSRFGNSVSRAGDINNDGIDDIIIGAHIASLPGTPVVGVVYVIFGSDDDFNGSFDLTSLSGTNGFRIEGQEIGDLLGESVSGGVDFNNDGIDDIAFATRSSTENGLDDAG
ncbi:MAG: hypothetical protein GY821_01505 [Gammaproteobacteria bacterium]|nr:hypothetical protein [Gammaproteobacteria bacterium]